MKGKSVQRVDQLVYEEDEPVKGTTGEMASATSRKTDQPVGPGVFFICESASDVQMKRVASFLVFKSPSNSGWISGAVTAMHTFGLNPVAFVRCLWPIFTSASRQLWR